MQSQGKEKHIERYVLIRYGVPIGKLLAAWRSCPASD
jgi:hypothetical protein